MLIKVNLPPRGGGGVGYSLMYFSPKEYGFWAFFKTGIDFAYFGLETGMVFKGNYGSV